MAYLGQPNKDLTSAFGDLLVAQARGETQLQFPYNITPEIVSVSITSTGTVISSPPFAVLSTGLSPTGSASFRSKDSSHYRTGEGIEVLFTSVFTSGVAGSQQYVGLGDAQNGFFFGYNGTSFGILYRQSVYGLTVTQVTTNNTWIPQSSWSEDPFDGTGISGVILDPTKGNVYKIEMQWLGFGDINFYIENPILGDFSFVHRIQYPNLNTNTSVSNPSLPLSATVVNSTNTNNMVLKVPSMAMFIEGEIYQNDVIYSISDSGTAGTTIAQLLSIKNVNTFNNIINNKVVVVSSISMSGSTVGTRSAIFYLILNATNAFTFVNVSSGNSCVQYDSTSTFTVTGGRTIFVFYLDVDSEENLDLSEFGIILNPGDILTVATQRGPGVIAPTVNVNLNWFERY